ncbi:M20/M25/M40 family metallo-hydrolase [Pseudactinotalea sp. Z1748]|uniref:M20/M25/M40 family metallo-hydrolase n=1 Tax=Pseudactinotalea sp. Z1748 TaxID=3413027 RepID=UPI003C7D9671
MNRTEQILAELISIPSVNPRHTAADGGETRIAEHLARWAQGHGWPGRLDEALPGRSNGVVTIPGELPGTIVLQTHSDTVEVQGMTVEPFRMERAAGRVTGRGVCDAKGQLAMFMAALERVADDDQPHHTIVLAACVDEEERFRGVLDLCTRLDPEEVLGAIVGEPTELALVTSHKGVLRGRILIDGPGGHSSMPDGVVNPITVAAEVIAYVAGEMDVRLRELTDPQVGAASLTLTMIDGGDAINIIPRQVALSYDRRTLPGEDPHAVWTKLQRDLEGRFNGVRVEEPALADPGLPHSEAPLVHTFQDVLSRHDLPAAAVGVPYGSDASKIARLGIPAMVFGAGSIKQAHTPDEYLDLDQLHRGVEVLHDLLTTDLTPGAA